MFKSEKHAQMRRWFGIISQYLSVQIIIQGLGFVVGIFLVRNFSTNEYAIYTLANGMQGMLSSLSDIGVGVGVMSIGGRIWQDKAAMGRLIRTALDLRKVFVTVTILIVAPVYAWLIYRSGAGAGYTFLLVVAVVAGVVLQLDSLTYGIPLKLNSQFSQVQKIDLQSGVFRAGTVLALSMVWKSALGAIALTTASWGLGRRLIMKCASTLVIRSSESDSGYRKELVSLTKSQLPNTLFYCVSSQVPVILISLFGQTSNIAEVGALGRLSALLLIISNLSSNVIMPGFARCQDANLLKRRYFQIVFGFCGFAATTIIFAFLFPHAILAILGKSYSNLEGEVAWMISSTMMGGLCGLLFGLCTSRGWSKLLWINIPVVIACQATTFFLFNLSTVKGVILFSLLPAILSIAVYHTQLMQGIRKMRRF